MLLPKKLDVGARGASVGAIGRPAGYLTGLARREGPLLYGKLLDPNGATATEENLNRDKFTALPTRLASTFLPARGEHLHAPADQQTPAQQRANAEAGPETTPTDLADLVCKMLGDPDMMILGVIKVCDFVKLLTGTLTGTLADNIPVFQEVQDYGQAALGGAIVEIKDKVVKPLRALVSDIRARLATAISGTISPAAILPNLDRALRAFDAALSRLDEAASSEAALAQATEVAAAGKALLRALEEVAKDPVSPLRSGLLQILEEQLGKEFPDLDSLTPIVLALNIRDLESGLLAILRERLKAEFVKIGWRDISTASLAQALGSANLDSQINTFFRVTLEKAIDTAFTDGVLGNAQPLARFSDVVNGLDFAGAGAGKEKWAGYVKDRADALASFLQSHKAELSGLAGDTLRDLLGRNAELALSIVDLLKRKNELKEIFEELKGELEDAALSAVEEVEARAFAEIDAARSRAEAQLAELRADLVRRIFGLDIATARALFTQAEETARVLSQLGEDSPVEVVKALGKLFVALDEAYLAGTYTQLIGRALSERLGDLVPALHRALCLAIDYANLATAGIKSVASDVPSEPDIVAAFAPLRPGSVASFDRLIALARRLQVQFAPNGTELGADNLLEGPANCLSILHDYLDLIETAVEKAKDDGLDVVATLLTSLALQHQSAFQSSVAALASFTRALAGLLRVRAGTLLTCPSEQDFLLHVTSGRIVEELDAMRATLEETFTGWTGMLTEAEALVDVLAAQLASIESEASKGARAAVTDALVEAQEDQKAFWLKTAADLDEAELRLCDCVVRAVKPTLMLLLRGADKVLGDVFDPVMAAKATLVAEMRTGLDAAETQFRVAQSAFPAASPFLRLGTEAIARLRETFAGCSISDPSLAKVVRRLDVYLTLPPADIPEKSALLTQLVEDLKALPDTLAAELACVPAPRPGVRPVSGGAGAILSLAKSLRVDTSTADSALAEVVESFKQEVETQLWIILQPAVMTLATFVRDKVYVPVLEVRKNTLRALVGQSDTLELAKFAAKVLLDIEDLRELFVAVDGTGHTRSEIKEIKIDLLSRFGNSGGQSFAGIKTEDGDTEKLQEEHDRFDLLARPLSADDAIKAFRQVSDVYGGRTYTMALLQIAQTIKDVVQRVLSADLSVRLDFADIRKEIEKALLSFVPTTITNTMTYNLKLKEIGGIFLPQGDDPRFDLRADTRIDLLKPSEVSVSTTATMSAFNIALFGDLFDVFTMKFSGARFTVKSGQDPDFDITFIGYIIGEKAKFIEELAQSMGADSGGIFLEPASGFPGIQAGYRLNLPAITLGAATFLNVGLVATAILPFDKREALFSVGISTRADPFIIIIGVWGGGGHFTLYTNGREMVGFDVSFVFAGGGAIAAGPLTLQGRVSVGIFLRRIGDFSETSGDFFAGGSGKIAIFGFSASLRVRVGQDGAGNMVGSAVFSFSFSVGIAKVRFSITLFKKEEQGFKSAGGEQSAFLQGRDRVVRWANAGTAGPLSDQLWLAALGDAPQLRGEADIRIYVPRFEDDFTAWRGNFASVADKMASCRRAFENA